jgi:DNA-directed RNA polymerase specialized sigma24 family protein
MAKAKKNYVNNAEFLAAMVEYKAQVKEAEECGDPPPRIPNYIGECLYQIATRLSYKPNFINYSYRDDMISDGLENAVLCINNFDPTKSSNPFAYFTQVIYFAFIRRIQKEKRQMYVKHKVIENSVIQGTAVTSSENSDSGGPAYIDLDNDYMNDFVKNYENSMEEKRKANVARTKKKGLENFYEDDE